MGIPSRLRVPPAACSGHTHNSNRLLSRRRFMVATAGATGAVLTAGLWVPPVLAASAEHPGRHPAVWARD